MVVTTVIYVVNTTCTRTCLLMLLAACGRRACPTKDYLSVLSDIIEIINCLKTCDIFSYDDFKMSLLKLLYFKYCTIAIFNVRIIIFL